MKELPPKRNNFKVPEGYFDNLPDKTWDFIQTQNGDASKVDIKRITPARAKIIYFIGLLAAAVIALLIVFLTPDSSGLQLDKISNDEIISYLEQNADNSDIIQMVNNGNLTLKGEIDTGFQIDSLDRETIDLLNDADL